MELYNQYSLHLRTRVRPRILYEHGRPCASKTHFWLLTPVFDAVEAIHEPEVLELIKVCSAPAHGERLARENGGDEAGDRVSLGTDVNAASNNNALAKENKSAISTENAAVKSVKSKQEGSSEEGETSVAGPSSPKVFISQPDWLKSDEMNQRQRNMETIRNKSADDRG